MSSKEHAKFFGYVFVQTKEYFTEKAPDNALRQNLISHVKYEIFQPFKKVIL